MKPYPKYKDSGVEWIGEIPEGWEAYRLSRTIKKITNGYVGPTRGVMQPSGVPYIQGIHIKNGSIQFTPIGNYYVDEEWSNNHEKSILREKDLLVVQTGNIGEVGLVPSDFNGANCHALIILRTSEEVLKPNYLLYYLLSPIGNFLLQRIKTGEILYHINCTKLRDIKVLIPPCPEQTAIANYLDRKTAELDGLIASKERLIELYEEEKTAIINQAVTKGLGPDVPMKPSGIDWLGDIPEHWGVNRLKYLGKFINGYSFKSDDFEPVGVRVLKISNIQHMSIDWEDSSYISEIFYEKLPNYRVFQGDLVFALTRPIISTGIKAALIDTDEPILINQRNSIFRPEKIDTKWIFYIILSSQFISEFDSRIDTTGQQPNISSNDIGDITIPVPFEAEQAAIISHIDTECSRLDTIIDKFKKQIEFLKEYRTTLISEVVTGKIDVRDEVVQ